ncbi:MAG: hypothetical protein SGI72_16115, partial [Planctomycetota bacterium]|nr:hypothetical protein [Planctomycetota bacterium]
RWPGGQVRWPGGQVRWPGGQVCWPGDQVCWPGGQVCWPGDQVCWPGDQVRWPGGRVRLRVGMESSVPVHLGAAGACSEWLGIETSAPMKWPSVPKCSSSQSAAQQVHPGSVVPYA